jgi:hypothetical protein
MEMFEVKCVESHVVTYTVTARDAQWAEQLVTECMAPSMSNEDSKLVSVQSVKEVK